MDRFWGFLGLWTPRFQATRHLKLVSLSTLCTVHLYPQDTFLVPIYVRDWFDTRAILRPEGLSQSKIPTKPSGIEPATFWLVAQCLNQMGFYALSNANRNSKLHRIVVTFPTVALSLPMRVFLKCPTFKMGKPGSQKQRKLCISWHFA